MRILLFGALRERLGADELTLSPAPPDVAALKRALGERHPLLAAHWNAIRIAVNQEFAADGVALQDADEVALIPPVAGGSAAARVSLGDAPLSIDTAMADVTTTRMGGVCLFAGMVRDHAHGHVVTGMEYSAYGPMALRELQRIVARAEEDHGAAVACHHRVGNLRIGELAVVIAAAAPHRDAAFRACRQVIEDLKQSVPIWKKEFGEHGAVWVGMGP
ncbi:MAG: molybdenum cofactor biosynthesis protein MoaE [Deltaproteobacteria bacterium]|nr:molybdenum cofactor biosynthesis protein MoaE [Deltaproteobacteria bacterium]